MGKLFKRALQDKLNPQSPTGFKALAGALAGRAVQRPATSQSTPQAAPAAPTQAPATPVLDEGMRPRPKLPQHRKGASGIRI